MTFSEFVDAVLYKLYEIDRLKNDGSFVSLGDIGAMIRANVPQMWAFDAAKVLQSRGLIQAVLTSMVVSAQITGEGRLFVEENRGHTKDIKAAPDRFFITFTGDGNQLAFAQTGSTITQTAPGRGPGLADRLVESIEKGIEIDSNLTPDQKDDAKSYVAVVRRQLRKEEPDRNILAAVLEPLSRVVTIAGQVANLIRLING